MKKPTRIAPTIKELDKRLKELKDQPPIDLLDIMFYHGFTGDDWETDGDKEISEIEKQQLRDPYNEEEPKDVINLSGKDKF